MEAVKLRENYQQALLLLSNLQQHPATYERALSKVFLLIRLCHSIQKTATALPDKDSSSIWQQRAANLHSDLTTATAQFLQSGDQSGEQFWDGCLRLLYSGAEAYDQIDKEKDTLAAQLLVEKEHRSRLEQTLLDQHQKLETALKENAELRSKIGIQQQIIEPLEKNYRETHQRLEFTIKEKHALATEKGSLAEERGRNLQILERQAKAIEQLMQQCEDHAKEKDQALESVKTTSEDNHTLRVNLGQHGQVIENLINLNAEMMDAANFLSVQLEQKKNVDEDETPTPSVNADQIEDAGGGKSSDEQDVDRKFTVPSKIQEMQRSPDPSPPEAHSKPSQGSSPTISNWEPPSGSSPKKITGGPSPDLFSRIKGKEQASDATHHLSSTEKLPPVNDHLMVVQNGDAPSDRGEPKKKSIAWTSDMLISQRGSASLENLQGLEEKSNYSHGFSSLDNLQDLEERASTVPSNSPSLLGKLGGVRGRLQAVGGKAKGFLDFVAGADLASAESP